MKVVALARTSLIGPSTRYRIGQYRAPLAKQGIEVQLLPLFGATWFRILDLRPAPLRVVCKALYSAVRLVARLAQLARALRSESTHSVSCSSPRQASKARRSSWRWSNRRRSRERTPSK